MNLLQELADTSMTWTLETSSRPHPLNPSRQQNTVLLSVKPHQEAPAVGMHFALSGFGELPSLESMVVRWLKANMPDHPLLRAWFDSKGNVPVKLALSKEDLQYIGYSMHTGLRKLADTTQSVITWNALHHMADEDRSALWTAVAEMVEKAFSTKKLPTRRAVANKLREEVLRVLDTRDAPVYDAGDGRMEKYKRTEGESFALRMMHQGCKLTGMDEWMWGWLGYVVEDVEDEQAPQEESAEPVAT